MKLEGVKEMKKIKISSVIALLCAGAMTTTAFADSFGVCTHMGQMNSYENTINVFSAQSVGADWIRDGCIWSDMQATKNGEFKIRDKDINYIKKTEDAGLNQLLVLAYGNPQYDGVEDWQTFPKQDNEAYYKGWLDYVRYTVDKVKDYVDAYEVWNEPNIESFNHNSLADGTDYAKLYLDTKAIINELDPTARVLCGAVTGYDETFAKAIFDYVKSQGNVNELIDVFSIHEYSQLDMESYAKALSSWESLFDSYGFNGDVWMTENGVTADDTKGRTETAQAQAVAKLAIQWESYLKDNNRNGVSFWYDLRNDPGQTDYEANFGLVDEEYIIKPSGKAMQTHNMLVGDKSLVSAEKVKTKNNIISADEYGYLATYSGNSGTVYVGYDDNDNSKSKTVTLSGDVAYVYDYLGNVTSKIDNPSGTKSITLKSEPTYIECRNVAVSVENVAYDGDEGIINVKGMYNGGESVTVELLKDDNAVESYTAVVENGTFRKWFSFDGEGEYTVRVGKPELESVGKTSGWAEQTISVDKQNTAPAFDVSTKTVYNADSKTVSISGKINDFEANQAVTVLAVPATMDINSVDIAAAAYIGQAVVSDGDFSVEFEVPDYFTTNMAIYLGGTGLTSVKNGTAEIAESDYLYVAGLELNKGNALKATAVVRNFNETERKAVLVVAQYSGDKLVDVETKPQAIPAKTYATIECYSNDVAINGEATSAKAFIWTDMDGIVPLFGADEISLSN